MSQFSKAVVRKPCKQIIKGLSNNNSGIPDYHKALKQHEEYVKALLKCNLEVTILDPDDRFPDSVFVEDTAVCTQKFALISKPGAPERENEPELILPTIREFYENIEFITEKGSLDGGDIMMVGKTYYIGISARTNLEGANQFINYLEKYDLKGIKVPLKTMLHLKTGLSYLENNNLLISGEFIENPLFEEFNKILVDENEQYAANSLWINDNVLVPKGFPETRKKIEDAGYRTIPVDTSEYRKVDGGLSCLSLRF
jgi:dimethylargininase